MAVTGRTRVILPVHLYGRPADMDPILRVAQKYSTAVLEDAAQAHGATYKGRRIGSIGRMAAFSFYPGKNLGAYGEGGAVTTSDESLDKRVRMLRDHGSEKKYYHDRLGYNARMEGIQGAVLGVKLKYLDSWTKGRQANAARYNRLFEESGLVKKGAVLERMHRLNEAFECYDRAIALNDSLTIAYLHKGGLCNRLERFKEALDCYEKALSTHSERHD